MQKIPKIYYLAGIISLLFFIIVVSEILPRRIQLTNLAQTESYFPQRVKISNIHTRGFSVSWVTDNKTTGEIIFGTNKESVEKNQGSFSKKQDPREGPHFVHNVDFNNLDPRVKYFFKIISGDGTFYKTPSGVWKEVGIVENVNLPENNGFLIDGLLSSSNSPGSFSFESGAFTDCLQLPQNNLSPCFRPNPVYGQVINTDGTIAKEALIYLQIPGKSNLLSSVTDEEGKWNIDIANLLKDDLSGPLEYKPGIDLLKIVAVGPSADENIVYKPIPSVLKTYQDVTNPIKMTILPPQTPISTPTPSLTPMVTQTVSSTPTKIPTQTPTPVPLNSLLLNITLRNYENKKDNKTVVSFWKKNLLIFSQTISLKPQLDGTYQGKIYSSKKGEYNLFVKPAGFLRVDLGLINLTAKENEFKNPGIIFIPGDINNDNTINSLDLSSLVSSIINKKQNILTDLNGDGKVNILDLSILISNYRKVGD